MRTIQLSPKQTVCLDFEAAAFYGHEDAVALLIERGADPNTETDDGRTALALARNAGDEALVDLLVQRGARD